MEKNEIWPLYYTTHRNSLEMDWRCKTWIYKITRRKGRKKFFDIDLRDNFVDMTPKAKQEEQKSRSSATSNQKASAEQKKQSQNEKATYGIEGNTSKPSIW